MTGEVRTNYLFPPNNLLTEVLLELMSRIGVEDHTDDSAAQSSRKYFDLMQLGVVHVIAIFIFAYVGTEVRT